MRFRLRFLPSPSVRLLGEPRFPVPGTVRLYGNPAATRRVTAAARGCSGPTDARRAACGAPFAVPGGLRARPSTQPRRPAAGNSGNIPKTTASDPQTVSTNSIRIPKSTPPVPQKVSPRCPNPQRQITPSPCQARPTGRTNSSSVQVDSLNVSRRGWCHAEPETVN